MKRRGIGVLLLAAACDAGGPREPEGTTVTITLANPTQTELPESLRLAVVWRTDQAAGEPWITTSDHALSATAERQPVRVELPQGVNLGELSDKTSIAYQCLELGSNHVWPGVTPLWVAYEDLDRDRRLASASADRVVAVTDFYKDHLAAFVDLEAVLSQLSFEEAECLRRFTGGGFSPFVSGQGDQSFYPDPAPVSEFTLSLSPTRYPAALLTCGRALTWSQPPVDGPTVLSVVPGLVPDACTAGAALCTRVAYDDDWTGAIEPISLPGYRRSAECISTGALDVLWVREETDECDGCTCARHRLDRGWVVSRDAPPIDWPCGDPVPICLTTSDRVEVIPSDCPI